MTCIQCFVNNSAHYGLARLLLFWFAKHHCLLHWHKLLVIHVFIFRAYNNWPTWQVAENTHHSSGLSSYINEEVWRHTCTFIAGLVVLKYLIILVIKNLLLWVFPIMPQLENPKIRNERMKYIGLFSLSSIYILAAVAHDSLFWSPHSLCIGFMVVYSKVLQTKTKISKRWFAPSVFLSY